MNAANDKYDEKLDEARFFLEHMKRATASPVMFKKYTSAFVSAARSSLQYAHNETGHNTGARQWYDSSITNN